MKMNKKNLEGIMSDDFDPLCFLVGIFGVLAVLAIPLIIFICACYSVYYAIANGLPWFIIASIGIVLLSVPLIVVTMFSRSRGWPI